MSYADNAAITIIRGDLRALADLDRMLSCDPANRKAVTCIRRAAKALQEAERLLAEKEAGCEK